MQGGPYDRLWPAAVLTAAAPIVFLAAVALAAGADARVVIPAALGALALAAGDAWLLNTRSGGDPLSLEAAAKFEADAQPARLLAVLDASELGIVAVDRDAAIRYLNPAAATMLGVEPAACLGRSAIAALRDHTALDALRQTLVDERRRSVTLAVPHDRICEATLAPVAEPSGWRAACFIQDVTDVRRLETMRRDFVSNVSHELRTPLASIKAVVETLQAGALEDPEVAQPFLEQVNGEVDRLVQLVEELLELGRIESGLVPFRFSPVRPGDLVRDCVRRLTPQAERAGLDLTAEADGDLTLIEADGERLGRALVNLIHNAIKFTPAGGSIVISAGSAGADVEIGVRDTGIGIAPADAARIFERFYKVDRSRESPGTGLGLAIVRHVVEAHGGSISLQSTPGHGSTFTMRIPALRPYAPGRGPEAPHASDLPLTTR